MVSGVADAPLATVLAVDDEPRILAALERVLKGRYRVLTATDGAAGLDLLRHHPVQVVISDQCMPTMVGVDFLAKVKSLSPHTVRVLLTGHSDMQDIERAINDGEVFRFINKPWKNDDLLALVEQCVAIANQTALHAMSAANEAISSKEADARVPVVLLVDAGGELLSILGQLLGTRVEVRHAIDTTAALRAMQAGDIGIVLAALSSGVEEELALLKSLKAADPSLLTVVLATAADAQQMIGLINEGQIYRYMTRPVRMGSLKMYLMSAIRYRQYLGYHPELAGRHVVETMNNAVERGHARRWRGSFAFLGRLFGRGV